MSKHIGILTAGGGDTPSAADRLLTTRLGTACADLIHEEVSGVIVAARGRPTRIRDCNDCGRCSTRRRVDPL